jgi:hypothetical protein
MKSQIRDIASQLQDRGQEYLTRKQALRDFDVCDICK